MELRHEQFAHAGVFLMKTIELQLSSVHALVASGAYSYEQLMRDTLNVIELSNFRINAIVAMPDASVLIEQAQKADREAVAGSLHGIPIAIKDLVNVAGIKSTFGSPLLVNNVPVNDDLIAQRIRNAGAIIIGKTNTPEFGLGSQTYNTVYGATATPYDLEKTSGGSSGGAAAALASGMLIVADGSDMMGSLRNPAAFCNVYGFRPSYGLVPNQPQGDLFMHQLATAGPMAKTIQDLAILLDVIAGPDHRHPHSIESQIEFATSVCDYPEAPMNIGWLADWSGSYPMEPGVLNVCEKALSIFENDGHNVERLEAPFSSEQLWFSWQTLRSFAVTSLLAETYHNKQTRSQLKPEAIYEVEMGLHLSGSTIAEASMIRAQWFAQAVELFSRFDILVLPSSQVFAFNKALHWPTHINKVPMSSYHRWMEVVVPASLLGLPALNVPAGFSESGMPMGMQLIGQRNNDLSVLRLGHQYHLATQWPQNRPP